MIFGVEQSDFERLIEVAKSHDAAIANPTIHMFDHYKLLTDNEDSKAQGKLLFDYMRGFNYEQIQTIQTIVHLGKEKNHKISDPEDLFDEKLISIRWSGDASTEILKLLATSDISMSLEAGLKILSMNENKGTH
ncbi:hypothetical protein [Fusibacter bizertensis]